MIVTDSAIAAVPQPNRGPLRALFAFLGLSDLSDDRRNVPTNDDGTISPPAWQQARVAAHRAIAAANQGDYAGADALFTTAFSLDRALKPGQIANFWNLSLTGLETAERALRSASRYDDASALASEVAYRYASHPARQPSQAAS